MERVNRIAIVGTILLLLWQEPLPGQAQSPDHFTATPTQRLLEDPPARDNAEPSIPAPRVAQPTPAEERVPQPERLTTPPSQKSPLELPPPGDGEVIDIKPPPTEPGDVCLPINLATALRLADARPIVVSATGASVWVAEAELQKAKVLWIPTMNIGLDYVRHDGYGPDLNRGVNIPAGVNALGQYSPNSLGRPLNNNINLFFAGTGFTFSPIENNVLFQDTPNMPLLPSPQVQFLTDIIFEPLRTRQELNSARWTQQTAKNDALLLTASAYFGVHMFRGQYAVSIDVVQRGRKLLAEISDLSRDLVPAVEIDRARNLLADIEQNAVSARENWRVASAKLTQVLRLDPRAVVQPLEKDHLQITLIDPSRSLDDLIPIALKNRPELASHQAMVQAMLVAIRREKLRPFTPALLINGFQTPYELLEFEGYGEGSGGKLNLWSYRNDISPQALWIASQMGFGNAADIKAQRGMASERIVELFRAQDSVAAEVTRAQADLQSAAARIVQAEREVRGALVNYNGNYEGLKQTKRFGNILVQAFRPQEAVFALQLLMTAYDNYIATVAQYNIAQFELFHALGYPARELSFLRQPGAIIPVDTSRPDYLPRVGTEAPPATR